MKKCLALILAAILTFAPVSASAINVCIDDSPLEVAAASVNGSTMVPMRAIFEKLGATVTWDQSTQSITAVKDAKTIRLRLNETTAYIDNTAFTLNAAPVSIDGRTVVPARFVAEAMGCSVDWDAASKTVNIFTADAQQPAQTNTYKVLRVVDGDTFTVDFNGTEEKVRLIGVDTPESVHPDASKNTEAGTAASEYTKSLLTGKDVTLEFDVQERDKYGRLLAYAYVDGYMLNKKLLQDGYAVIATYPPNVKYLEDFKAIAGSKTAESDQASGNASQSQSTSAGNIAEAAYIGNANTKKFHVASCSSVKKMSNENKIALANRTDAISRGYDPCGICNP